MARLKGAQARQKRKDLRTYNAMVWEENPEIDVLLTQQEIAQEERERAEIEKWDEKMKNDTLVQMIYPHWFGGQRR